MKQRERMIFVNNRNWLMVFFGLACLVLLVGVFTTSTTLPNGTTRDNGLSPQQINQTLPNTTTPNAQDNNQMSNMITEQPKDQQYSTEMDPNKMGQDMKNGATQLGQDAKNGMKDAGDAMKNMLPNMNA